MRRHHRCRRRRAVRQHVALLRSSVTAAVSAQPEVAGLVLQHPELGAQVFPTPAPRFSKTPAHVATAAPAVGADQHAVLRDWLHRPAATGDTTG